MPISFKKLLDLFEDRGISTYTIRVDNVISQSALTKIKNNRGNIDTRTIEKLCAYLDCQPGDIMEYVKDE